MVSVVTFYVLSPSDLRTHSNISAMPGHTAGKVCSVPSLHRSPRLQAIQINSLLMKLSFWQNVRECQITVITVDISNTGICILARNDFATNTVWESTLSVHKTQLVQWNIWSLWTNAPPWMFQNLKPRLLTYFEIIHSQQVIALI